MNNNDVLRRLRYTFDFNDKKIIAMFALVDEDISETKLRPWFKKDDDAEFKNLSDVLLASFLNGFIIEKRGKKEGPLPVAEKKLTNNIIFRKIKIALNLQADEIIELLNLADLYLSKHELSAFFRKASHKNYRECKDQILRNFLKGVQIKYRPPKEEKTPEKSEPTNKPAFEWKTPGTKE